jgi:hypothetical protein
MTDAQTGAVLVAHATAWAAAQNTSNNGSTEMCLLHGLGYICLRGCDTVVSLTADTSAAYGAPVPACEHHCGRQETHIGM